VSGGHGDEPAAGIIATMVRDGHHDGVALEKPREIRV
jgi:hypothetical protein